MNSIVFDGIYECFDSVKGDDFDKTEFLAGAHYNNLSQKLFVS